MSFIEERDEEFVTKASFHIVLAAVRLFVISISEIYN